MYHGIITLSVIMFGVAFLLNDKYQKESGNSIGSALLFCIFNSLSEVIRRVYRMT
ncbi:MAG: hypothetical protein J6S23_07440 [Clostridia bacterium]|nr:hypothetical protein [Clostridia bacterium]